MHKTMFKRSPNLILLLMGLLCLWSAQAMAQTPEDPIPPDTDSPPFITDLVDITALTQEQVAQMRSDGLGWGNIMIATRLAERIAADSDGTLTFDEALAGVLNARAEGKGFGQIAHENDLKLGRVVGDEDAPDSTNPPPFIGDLVDITELTPEQVGQMRSDGLGWGNIMIAARLAERIAADSDGTVTFDEALTGVLDARAEGKGFGQIAHENDLKLGRVVGNGNKEVYGLGEGNVGRVRNIARRRGREKKQNIYSQLSGLLGFEKKEGSGKPSKPDKLDRPERPVKPEKLEKPERPEKPEKPERPEKPEKPERPEKPEKPERGPRR
jgi:hypothetical protein